MTNTAGKLEAQRGRVSDWRSRVVSQRALIVEHLANHYPIKSLFPLEGPYWNAAFKAVGPQEEYFVKIFNVETTGVSRTVDDLEIVAATLESLYEAGFKALARPKRSNSGKAAFRCGPYTAMVFEWIRGTQKSLDESCAQSSNVIAMCAPVLALLHEAGGRMPFTPLGLMRREVPYALSPARWADALDELWSNAERSLRERGAGPHALKELRRARGLSEDLVIRRRDFFDRADTKPTILHGDFRPENLIRVGEPFVVDFDMVHTGPPEADIAYAGLCFSGPRWFMGPRVRTKCAAFVRAYRNCAGIRFPEAHWLSAAFEYAILKAASLSFREDQLLARLALYCQIQGSLDQLSAGIGKASAFPSHGASDSSPASPKRDAIASMKQVSLHNLEVREPLDVPGHLAPYEGSWLTESARGGIAIEVGSYRGRSTCFIAKEARLVIACDPFCGQPIPRPEQHRVDFTEVRRNWAENTTACGVRDRIILLELSSAEAYSIVEQCIPGPFDLAFIDGSHHENDLRGDVRFANLLRIGGIIAFHDYGDARYPDVLRIVDEWAALFRDAFELIPAPGTIRAFRKLRDRTTAADWTGASL